MTPMLKSKHNEEVKNTKDLTLVGHLAELRKRLIYSALVFIVSVISCYNFAEIAVEDIINIVPDINFVFIAPAELLMSYIKISVVGGLVISAPFLLIQLWLFVSPGLNSNERKYISVSLITGSVFFIIGVVFSYFIVLPTMIMFFI